MRHLIAKRNRVRDMLTELENDPYLEIADTMLREVIDDDNFTFLLVERQQLLELRWTREIAEHGFLDDGEKALPAVYGFKNRLMEVQGYTKAERGRLEYWEGKLAEAQGYINNHRKAIQHMFEDVQHRWGQLTPRDQAAFGRPCVNPIDVFDFATYVNAELAMHYPEPTAHHITATDKLRHILEWLDAEIAKEGDK